MQQNNHLDGPLRGRHVRRLPARGLPDAPRLLAVLIPIPFALSAEATFYARLQDHLAHRPPELRMAYATVDLLNERPATTGVRVLSNSADDPNAWLRYASVGSNAFFLSKAPGPFDPSRFDERFSSAGQLCGGTWGDTVWERAILPNAVDLRSRSTGGPSLEEEFAMTVVYLGLPNPDPRSLQWQGQSLSGMARLLEQRGGSRRWNQRPFRAEVLTHSALPTLEYALAGDPTRYRVAYNERVDTPWSTWPPRDFVVSVLQTGRTSLFYRVVIASLRSSSRPAGPSHYDVLRRIDTNRITLLYHEPRIIRQVLGDRQTPIARDETERMAKRRRVFAVVLSLALLSLPALIWTRRRGVVQRSRWKGV